MNSAIGVFDYAKPLPASLRRRSPYKTSHHIARKPKASKLDARSVLTDACHEECASQSRLLMLTDAYLRTRPGTPAARVALDRLMEAR